MMSQPHVLYIEDNEFNQRLVNKILESAGFMVSQAHDGLQGIRKAIDLHPDLILMDLNLPQLDGLGATTKIKSVSSLKSVPIIALSSKSSKYGRDRALVAGCDGYIEKPIDVKTFAGKIRGYLEGEREQVEPAEKDSILEAYNVNLVNQLQGKVEELKKTNRELQESQDELQEAYDKSQFWNRELQQINRLKENIVAITSHELRTPLSIAVGYMDLLSEGILGGLNNDQREVIDIAKQNLLKINHLIARITNLSLIAWEKSTLEMTMVDLNEVLRATAHEMAFFLEIRKQTLTLDLSLEKLMISTDQGLMSQVFANLLKNAICFTPDGGNIKVSSRTEADKIFFSIEDSGIGLKEEDLNRIFDSFYQVQNVEHHKSGQFEFMSRGIGVGLALCKGILNKLGGKIWSESSGPNKGSKFTFYLPLVTKE